MKQYIDFVRNGKAECGIDIIYHMVGNDTDDEDILEVLMKEKENSISIGKNGIKVIQDEEQTLNAEVVKDVLYYDDDNYNVANGASPNSITQDSEELCHFIYPGLDEKEVQQVHR